MGKKTGDLCSKSKKGMKITPTPPPQKKGLGPGEVALGPPHLTLKPSPKNQRKTKQNPKKTAKTSLRDGPLKRNQGHCGGLTMVRRGFDCCKGPNNIAPFLLQRSGFDSDCCKTAKSKGREPLQQFDAVSTFDCCKPLAKRGPLTMVWGVGVP